MSSCEIRQKLATALRNFRLTDVTEDLSSNQGVEVDTTFIQIWAVLHKVEEATQFVAAAFLRTQS